jgi:TetR/AcrR family transcriptional regulator of autoinduction and epiphytic fitness
MNAGPALDPRIERSRARILAAALQELGEAGYGAFTIEAVAARSGVAKSTIYRHWPGKLALISDAFRTFHAAQGPDLASGSPRERLVRIVRHVAEIVSGSTFSACIPALIDGAERDPDLRAFHHRFQAEARRPLVAAVAETLADEGAARRDPDLVATALLGPLFYARLMSDAPLDPGRAANLVQAVLGERPADR